MSSISPLQLSSLPLYWRLKKDKESSPVPERMPFSISFDDHGLLLAERNTELLDALSTIYTLDANIGYLQEGYDIARPYLEDFWSYLEKQLPAATRPLRILEIGCGGAVLLGRLKNLGHEVLGIDPSPLSRRASAAMGIEILPTMLQRGLDIGSFDLIFSMDVLEHAFDPDDFISLSNEYLKDGGRVIYSVPDAGPSIDLDEISFAMHQHLQYFTELTLRDRLERSGLSSVRVSKSDYGGSLYGVGQSSGSAAGQMVYNSAAPHTRAAGNRKIEKMQINHAKVVDYLKGLLKRGGIIGCYSPLRALPYISAIQQDVVENQMRFIDDTEPWQGKLFDGFSIPVFGISNYVNNPPSDIVIFSLTFENSIARRIRETGIMSRVTTLREILKA